MKEADDFPENKESDGDYNDERKNGKIKCIFLWVEFTFLYAVWI